MGKFNKPANADQAASTDVTATTNFEGGVAFTLEAKIRLYTRVATSLVGENKFYQKGDEHNEAILADIVEVAKLDPEFVLKMAAYVRQVLHLRSIPILMLVEASRILACKPFVRRWTPQIVQRADELTEVIAYWTSRYGNIGERGEKGGLHAFPNSLKKGLIDAFAHFDEYQLAKYDREGSVKLRDVLRIIHPRPADAARTALYRYLVKGEIDGEQLPLLATKAQLTRKKEFDTEAQSLVTAAHATWEVVISQFGGSMEIWEAVLPQMGYMAKLRNLRNFIEKGVTLAPVLSHLTNETAVRNSNQLPFRFFAAYREVEKLAGTQIGMVLDALVKALTLSTANLPWLAGTSFIVMDNSGSMDSSLSQKSSIRYSDVANLLGAIAHTMCEHSVTGAFGTDFALVNVSSHDSILTNMKKFAEADTKGMSTNAYRCVQWLRQKGIKVDRIIILSDMQCYDSDYRASSYSRENSLAAEVLKYRSQVNPDVFVHSIDLAGYGTAQFPENWPRVAMWAGWSERVLEAIRLFEEDKQQAVERIASQSFLGIKGEENVE